MKLSCLFPTNYIGVNPLEIRAIIFTGQVRINSFSQVHQKHSYSYQFLSFQVQFFLDLTFLVLNEQSTSNYHLKLIISTLESTRL